jgi:hypothetical protein
VWVENVEGVENVESVEWVENVEIWNASKICRQYYEGYISDLVN